MIYWISGSANEVRSASAVEMIDSLVPLSGALTAAAAILFALLEASLILKYDFNKSTLNERIE